MRQEDFRGSQYPQILHYEDPPPSGLIPVVQRLIAVYKLWHEMIPNIPKRARYGLGGKIDTLFIQTAEGIVTASYAGLEEKLLPLQNSIRAIDLLKFFLRVAWEIKGLDNRQYVILSEHIEAIGKMTGGWHKQILEKINPRKRE